MTKPDPDTVSQRATHWVNRAELLAAQRQWQPAEELFRQAIELDPSPAHRISFAVCLAQQERYFEAISIFTPILDERDRAAVGVVCHNLASIYREVGDADLARRFQWRATLLHDDLGSAELLGMANDSLLGDRLDVAESLMVAACEMDDVSDELVDGDLVGSIGLLKAELESTEEGLKTLFVAYRRHQAAGDLRAMGIDQMNMAALFGMVDRPRAERSCLERAIRHFQQAPAPHSLQKARQQLARLDRIQQVREFDARRN